MGNGFIPTGTGPEGARFGREPVSGLAYKANGKTRAKRRTFTAVEAMTRLAEQAGKAMAGIGRTFMRALPGLAGLRSTVGTFRKWVRDAKAYATPEACAERRAYHERMIQAIDGKHKAAKAWLPGAAAAIAAIDGLYSKVGTAFAEFRKANGRDPTPAESEAIVNAACPADVRKVVEGAADPANDPFAAFRRDAADPDTASDGEDDDLGNEDDENEDDES